LSTIAALGSALFIGSADFVGGWASRRASNLVVTLWINIVAAIVVGIACAIVQPHLSSSHVIGALVGGCVSAVAINLIYAAFAAGAMSLAAPLIACGTAIVPTVAATIVGTPPDAAQGVGILFTLAGVLTITWTPRASNASLSHRAMVLTALASLAGGIAFSILLLSAKGGAGVALGVSGLSRLASLTTCAVLVLVSRTPAALPVVIAPRVFGAGLLEAGGVTLFLLASSFGNSAVVAVLVSLYAIVTVLLAQTLLRERIASHQGWGIAMSAVGVALLSAG
jgi:drug/metabolite transporter (DMT)-like permease